MPSARNHAAVSAFDGQWDDGDGTIVTIESLHMKGPDGQAIMNLVLQSDGSCLCAVGDEVTVARLSDDRASILWDDGEVWTRRTAPKPELVGDVPTKLAVEPKAAWGAIEVLTSFVEALEVAWPGAAHMNGEIGRPGGPVYGVDWMPLADAADARHDGQGQAVDGVDGGEIWGTQELTQSRVTICGIPEGTRVRLRVAEERSDGRRAAGPWVEAKTLEVDETTSGCDLDPDGVQRGGCQASGCWGYITYGHGGVTSRAVAR